MKRTLEKLKRKIWWQRWIKNFCRILNSCVQCTVSNDCKPGRQARLEITYLQRKFSEVALDAQTITPRTEGRNEKVLAIANVFTRFVKAVPIPDEKTESIAQSLINKTVAIFGPMERLLSDCGPSLTGAVI